MPKQVLPTPERFAQFCRAMEDRGYRRVSRKEFQKDFKRLSLIAPSARIGAEIGFVFHANGLDVAVWTTVLRDGGVREQDSGWVVIRDRDEARYFTHPLHRTKNYLERLWKCAQVARQRVLNRPLCPECHQFMRIVNGRAIKARYWSCDRRYLHPSNKKNALDWDVGLSPKARAFVEKERKSRARHRRRMLKAGKRPGTALLKRHPWRIGRAENFRRSI
jgi:hypothetical protein